MISWSPSSCSFDFRYGTEAVWKLLLEIEIFFRNNEIHLWEAVNYIFKNELNVITKSGFRSQNILNCHTFFIMLYVFQELKVFQLKKKSS